MKWGTSKVYTFGFLLPEKDISRVLLSLPGFATSGGGLGAALSPSHFRPGRERGRHQMPVEQHMTRFALPCSMWRSGWGTDCIVCLRRQLLPGSLGLPLQRGTNVRSLCQAILSAALSIFFIYKPLLFLRTWAGHLSSPFPVGTKSNFVCGWICFLVTSH